MSSTHYNHVIKCFTYDWLIRFMDLSPDNATNKLAAISPLFNQCANKYAPVFINLENNIYKAIAYNIPSDIKKKTVYTGKVCINNSNELSKLMHPCFYFHLTEIALMKVVSLEFTDLKRLLGKSIENQVILKECKFKMPVLFSELWSLVCHCEDIRLDVDNLHYDINIATIVANSEPCYRLTHLELYRLPPSVDIVYPIVSHSITTRREKGALILFFSSDVSGRMAEKIADAIRYKIHLADFKFFTNASSAAAPNMVRFIFKKHQSLDN